MLIEILQNYISIILRRMHTDSLIFKKQAYVGSLLTYPIDNFSDFKLATWYRVTANQQKIVKMKIINCNQTLSYRSTVYDAGSFIELRLEKNQNFLETIKFGPIKFDPYFLRQLEQKKHNLSYFSVSVHIRTNQTIPAKIYAHIGQQELIQIHLQFNKTHIICIQIPYKDDWKLYQQIFCLQHTKLTDIYLRNFVKTPEAQQDFRKLNIKLDLKNYLHFTFINVLQRNLFLSQIFKKLKNQSRLLNRPSQVKSIVVSDSKGCLQNQMDDLFKPQNPMVSSQLSEKIFKDFQEVIFTPQSLLQAEQSRQKYFSIFDQFLNPQNRKEETLQKLSDIVEDENQQAHQRTTSNLAIKGYSKTQKLRKSICSSHQSAISIQKFKKTKNQNESLEQILRANQQLLKQNQTLKKQNSYLKNRLRKSVKIHNKSTKAIYYFMPQFIKNKTKQKTQNQKNTMLTKQIFNDQETLSRDRSFNFVNQKEDQDFYVKKDLKKCVKKKHSHAQQRTQYEQQMKKKSQLISMSAKTVKRFPQYGMAN